MKTIRLANIELNDMNNGDGICISVWLQGCPHHCLECHNPETWSFDGGKIYYQEQVISEVLKSINKNNILRNLSLLGGEPLCPENREFSLKLAAAVKEKFPKTIVYCWTGYTLEELDTQWLENIDILIDGKYEKDLRDITLYLRGSSNQRVLRKGIDFLKK